MDRIQYETNVYTHNDISSLYRKMCIEFNLIDPQRLDTDHQYYHRWDNKVYNFSGKMHGQVMSLPQLLCLILMDFMELDGFIKKEEMEL